MVDYPALDLRFEPDADAAALHDLLYAALDDFAPLAIHDDEAAGWRVFFRSAAGRDAAATALTRDLPGRLTSVTPADVPDDGWAQRSQAALTPVRAGRIVVAPPWDVPEAGDDVLIVIHPSTGFGTGHHETTRLCLELLQSIDLRGRRAIDVGTGSGVLAIAAWKLGAASVIALDHDPDALRNARENVARNRADGVAVQEADLAEVSLIPADAVIANLTGATLRTHAGVLAGLAAPGGDLIVSGFAIDEVAAVEKVFPSARARTATEGSWGAIHFVRHPPRAR